MPAEIADGMMANSKMHTHERIVKAAHELFTEIGFDATKIEMIAERANVSRQTVYEYYQTKEDLYSAALKLEALEFDKKLSQIDHLADPVIILTNIIHAMFDEFVGAAKFTILDVKLHERIFIPDVVRKIGATHHSAIQAALLRGKGSGLFAEDSDASVFQATIIMVLTGFAFSNEVIESLIDIDCSTGPAMMEWRTRLTDILLRSIARPPPSS